MFVMGNVFGETEFELNSWKVGVIFWEVTLCKIKVLGLFG